MTWGAGCAPGHLTVHDGNQQGSNGTQGGRGAGGGGAGGPPIPGPGPPIPGPGPGPPGPHGVPGIQGGGGGAADATPAAKPADEPIRASAIIAEPIAARWERLTVIAIWRMSFRSWSFGLPRGRRWGIGWWGARLPRRGGARRRWRCRVGDPRREEWPQSDRSGAQDRSGHPTLPLAAQWQVHEFPSVVIDVDDAVRQRIRRCHESVDHGVAAPHRGLWVS